MSKQKKSNAKKAPSRSLPRPAIRTEPRWTDPLRAIVVGVVTACAWSSMLTLIAHIVGRR